MQQEVEWVEGYVKEVREGNRRGERRKWLFNIYIYMHIYCFSFSIAWILEIGSQVVKHSGKNFYLLDSLTRP